MKQELPSLYVSRTAPVRFPSAYLLLERIDCRTGNMLASTWDKERRSDPSRRQRLFRGIARTILSLARVPQSRIGSFRFHDDGTVALTNRPLTSTIVLLENSGAPRTIQQDDTYQCTEAFVSDMLTFHDDSFLSNPNAAYSLKECQAEMAVKTTLRALSHKYVRRQSRTGPFPLQFTDLHIGNILVDHEWNVTCVIDLEWVYAMPAEMLTVPYWLTGRGIDMLDGESFAEFNSFREEFMLAFEEEEQKMPGIHGLPLARIMQESWDSGGAWFWLSLDSVNAAYSLVYDHILPRFTRKLVKFRETMYGFWSQESDKVVQTKLADYRAYDEELRKVFGMPNGLPQTWDSGPSVAAAAATGTTWGFRTDWKDGRSISSWQGRAAAEKEKKKKKKRKCHQPWFPCRALGRRCVYSPSASPSASPSGALRFAARMRLSLWALWPLERTKSISDCFFLVSVSSLSTTCGAVLSLGGSSVPASAAACSLSSSRRCLRSWASLPEDSTAFKSFGLATTFRGNNPTCVNQEIEGS